MARSLPINQFNSSETIFNLAELIAPQSVVEVIAVCFGTAKSGCMIPARPPKDDRAENTAKNDLSAVLEKENIAHQSQPADDAVLVFIGETELLPDDGQHLSRGENSNAINAQIGRFLGVPEEDNHFIESNGLSFDDPQPYEVLDITDEQRYYLRLVSWRCAATEESVERAVAHAHGIEDAVEKAIEKHPSAESLLRLYLEYSRLRGSSKFYGEYTTEFEQEKYNQFTELLDEVPNKYHPEYEIVDPQKK